MSMDGADSGSVAEHLPKDGRKHRRTSKITLRRHTSVASVSSLLLEMSTADAIVAELESLFCAKYKAESERHNQRRDGDHVLALDE